jgi:CDP-diacylglycerol--serine O-phosphatidyltransferase
MDPVLPELEEESRRRRRIKMFRHRRIPVRMLVPSFFTLLALCAGLTAIRMAIELRFELALAAIVIAASLDSVDGRVARLLKASSRFGAELDSLADFVNFGVAPAVVLYVWGFNTPKGLGWIIVLVFAISSALRLARFNVALEEERPHWQSNYFSGMPVPAAAIVVLLPVYLAELGVPVKSFLPVFMVYTVVLSLMMVSTIPTFSGKLLGERVSRELVLPIFILAMIFVALLVTYPYETLSLGTFVYLALIPYGIARYRHHTRLSEDVEKPDEPSADNRVVKMK